MCYGKDPFNPACSPNWYSRSSWPAVRRGARPDPGVLRVMAWNINHGANARGLEPGSRHRYHLIRGRRSRSCRKWTAPGGPAASPGPGCHARGEDRQINGLRNRARSPPRRARLGRVRPLHPERLPRRLFRDASPAGKLGTTRHLAGLAGIDSRTPAPCRRSQSRATGRWWRICGWRAA